MKIVLIQPPLRDFYQTAHRHSALGSTSVKKILEQAGHDVVFFNFPLWKQRSTPPLPGELNYLKPFLIPGETGPVSWFTQRKHYGPPFEECAHIVLAEKPDLIMISCFAWCYAEEARQTALALRQMAPRVPLEAGGAGVSVNPAWFEQTGLFRRVRTGPAEENLQDFPGVPASLPPVTPVIKETRPYKGRPQLTAMLTRGCPARCTFCANHLTLGREFRKSDPDEILTLLAKTGYKKFHLNLEDDNLLSDQAYFLDFLDRFMKRFPGSTLSAENGLDYRKITIPIADRLIESGFIRFNLSMASSDSKILADQKRSSRLDHLETLIKHLENREIPAVTYFIAGLPGDTPESVTENLLYLSPLPTEIGISPFYAVPGLSGFEHPGENGLPEQPAVYCGSSVFPWNKNLTTSRLITAFRLSRLANLLKSPEKDFWRELVSCIYESGNLQTITGKGRTRQIIPVPRMDGDMVDHFLKNTQN